MGNKIDRRDFLALMGLGGATAATVGCGSSPNFDETWKPWVEPVEGSIPYQPNYYATTTHESKGAGLWVKVIGGRATKVDGNPEHPINGGKTTASQQSVVQNLYGQGRVRKPTRKDGTEITWRETNALLKEQFEKNSGKNIHALTNGLTGSLQQLWTRFIAEMGTGKLVQYEAFSQSDLLLASEKVFGQQVVPQVTLKGADMVLSLGARFLETWGDVVSNSRDYAALRQVHDNHRGKHVQVEAKISGTGANADQVIHAKPGSETLIALALLKEVASHAQGLSPEIGTAVSSLTANFTAELAASAGGIKPEALTKLAEELLHSKAPVVLPAETLSLGNDSVRHHAAVLLLNKVLGGIGKFYNYDNGKPITRVPDHSGITELISSLESGSVDMLLIKGTNPAYSLAPGLDFGKAVAKAGFTIAFADTFNETTALADLVIPVTHDLESWGEISTYKGLDMLMQPVMTPRWDCKQAEDHLLGLLEQQKPGTIEEANYRDYLKKDWLGRFAGEGADPETSWRDDLKRGGRFSLAETGSDLPLSGNLPGDYFANIKDQTVGATALVVACSARYGDGTCADRGWMQELPDTMTGVVWGSTLEISKEKAHGMGLKIGDVVKVEAAGQVTEVPVIINETTADSVVTLETGLGHKNFAPHYNRGVNAFQFFGNALNEAGQLSAGPMKVTLTKTGKREKVATFHLPGKGDQINTPLTLMKKGDHHYDRGIYQQIGVGAIGHEGDHGGGHHEVMDKTSTFPMHTDKNFYPDRGKDPIYKDRDITFYQDYKWEMTIDLNSCTGCGSCVTACYAENNLPVVGKDQVVKGREMAWLRINRYLGHTKKNGEEKTYVGFLPMLCQQCANAPCESVCPSLATYHNKEGLNAMVYNRCVGTRYCSNNCSYKVRRFNWYSWQFEGDLKWQMNPEVSVRQKGVMEKCTFCAQRIRLAKNDARDQNRKVKDGDFQTACQQACAADAIQFGNVKDESSKVYKLAHDSRAYRALDGHLHTKPGISYLKRVTLDDEHHG